MRVVGPCLVWQGYKNSKGYGQRKVGGRKGKVWLVHRLAWTEAHGDPGDLCVLHTCDNPACYNVEHLFLGTRADNNRDMAAKDRASRANKSHCPRGHPYWRDAKGNARCTPCNTEANRRWRSCV